MRASPYVFTTLWILLFFSAHWKHCVKWLLAITTYYQSDRCLFKSLVQSNLKRLNSDISRKQKFRKKVSYFIMTLYVFCTHWNRLIEAILMSTLNIKLLSRKSKTKSLNYRYLLPDLAPWLTLNGWNFPCLEQFSMVPKRFEPLEFDCIYYSNLRK